MDRGAGDTQSVEKEGVCERAQVQYCRNPDTAWPFLFSIKSHGLILVNQSPRTSKYKQATQVGEALL
jgi:hypothetical protein